MHAPGILFINFGFIYLYANLLTIINMPQHIKRLIITFAVVIGLFLGLRYLLVPGSFGEYGHYRGESLIENADKPLHYAGTASCNRCHQDVVDEKYLGHHAGLACEGCHGPAYAHAIYADSARNVTLPDSLKLERNISREFCAVCHEKDAARIKMKFDTVNNSVIKVIEEKKHNYIQDKETMQILKCVECHNPHDP